jgi:hypothetical protein
VGEGKVIDRARASQLLSTWMRDDPVVHVGLRSSGVDPVVVWVSVQCCEQAWSQDRFIVRAVDASLDNCNRDLWDFRQARRKGETCGSSAADDLSR